MKKLVVVTLGLLAVIGCKTSNQSATKDYQMFQEMSKLERTHFNENFAKLPINTLVEMMVTPTRSSDGISSLPGSKCFMTTFSQNDMNIKKGTRFVVIGQMTNPPSGGGNISGTWMLIAKENALGTQYAVGCVHDSENRIASGKANLEDFQKSFKTIGMSKYCGTTRPQWISAYTGRHLNQMVGLAMEPIQEKNNANWYQLQKHSAGPNSSCVLRGIKGKTNYSPINSDTTFRVSGQTSNFPIGGANNETQCGAGLILSVSPSQHYILLCRDPGATTLPSANVSDSTIGQYLSYEI